MATPATVFPLPLTKIAEFDARIAARKAPTITQSRDVLADDAELRRRLVAAGITLPASPSAAMLASYQERAKKKALTLSQFMTAVADDKACRKLLAVPPAPPPVVGPDLSTVPVAQILIVPRVSELEEGKTISVEVRTVDAQEKLLLGRPVAFHQSDANIASWTYGASGARATITAKQPGTVTLIAKCEGVVESMGLIISRRAIVSPTSPVITPAVGGFVPPEGYVEPFADFNVSDHSTIESIIAARPANTTWEFGYGSNVAPPAESSFTVPTEGGGTTPFSEYAIVSPGSGYAGHTKALQVKLADRRFQPDDNGCQNGGASGGLFYIYERDYREVWVEQAIQFVGLPPDDLGWSTNFSTIYGGRGGVDCHLEYGFPIIGDERNTVPELKLTLALTYSDEIQALIGSGYSRLDLMLHGKTDEDQSLSWWATPDYRNSMGWGYGPSYTADGNPPIVQGGVGILRMHLRLAETGGMNMWFQGQELNGTRIIDGAAGVSGTMNPGVIDMRRMIGGTKYNYGTVEYLNCFSTFNQGPERTIGSRWWRRRYWGNASADGVTNKPWHWSQYGGTDLGIAA